MNPYIGSMRKNVRTLLLSFLLAFAATDAAWADTRVLPAAGGRYDVAQDDRRFPGRRRPDYEQQVIPIDVIINRIAQNYPGRLLDAEGPVPVAGRLVYRIRWLTPDGRIIVIIVDAQTGQVLQVRGRG